MTTGLTGTSEEWLAARLGLLEAEKELTRRSDELARRRQELPWVRVDKQYRFAIDQGNASLADLFSGRSQLLVYHFMFGPDYTAGCPSGSTIADVVYHTYSTYARGLDGLGACTSGSTAAPRDAMRPSGGAATTSTTSADPIRQVVRSGCRWPGETEDPTTHGSRASLPAGLVLDRASSRARMTHPAWCARTASLGLSASTGEGEPSRGIVAPQAQARRRTSESARATLC
jgi:hypothetical protein